MVVGYCILRFTAMHIRYVGCSNVDRAGGCEGVRAASTWCGRVVCSASILMATRSHYICVERDILDRVFLFSHNYYPRMLSNLVRYN